MNYYEKTLLSVYKSLDGVINQMEHIIKQKARNSYYDYTPCEIQAENILKIVNARFDLIELKNLIEEAVSKLNETNKLLITFKYFKIKPNFEFDHTSRNYFRKQIKALNSFSIVLKSLGFNEKQFESKYLTMPFIYRVYKKILIKEGKQ